MERLADEEGQQGLSAEPMAPPTSAPRSHRRATIGVKRDSSSPIPCRRATTRGSCTKGNFYNAGRPDPCLKRELRAETPQRSLPLVPATRYHVPESEPPSPEVKRPLRLKLMGQDLFRVSELSSLLREWPSLLVSSPQDTPSSVMEERPLLRE